MVWQSLGLLSPQGPELLPPKFPPFMGPIIKTDYCAGQNCGSFYYLQSCFHCYEIHYSHPYCYLALAVQSSSRFQLFLTPGTTAYQASLCLTISQSVPKFMSIASVMPSNNPTLCCPLLLLPSIFPSIRVVANELALGIRWPK